MAGIAAAIIGAGVLGAGASIYAANKQTSAANAAIAAQQGMFNTATGQFESAKAAQQPFITAGQTAAGTLSDLLKPGADMSTLLKNIPGFKFLQDITQQGVANQATTTGLGGNTLLAGANAGTQLALSAGWNPIVNALQGLVNTGAGAAGSVQGGAAALGGQAVQTGGNIGSNLVGIGNAQAGAATSVGSNIGNAMTTAMLFNKLLAPQGGANYAGQGMYNTGNYGGTAGILGPLA